MSNTCFCLGSTKYACATAKILLKRFDNSEDAEFLVIVPSPLRAAVISGYSKVYSNKILGGFPNWKQNKAY